MGQPQRWVLQTQPDESMVTLESLLVALGAWMIHVVLIATGKLTIDAIPGMTQNISWTAVNLSYLAVRPCPVPQLRPTHPSLLT